jgi:hypothetical protein
MAELNPIVDPTLVTATTDAVMNALIKAGVIKVPKAARKRVNWERLLMYEYANQFYADKPKWFREEVGPIPGGHNDPIYSRTRRWADCIVRMDDHMLLIEGKMKAKVEVVSQMLTYKSLLPQTPMLIKYKDLPIKLLLVCAMIDDETRKFVESAGIEVEIYKPSNFEDWYKWKIEQKTAEE